jgi:hypothetical protein
LIYVVGKTLRGVSSNDVGELKAKFVAKRTQSQAKSLEALNSKFNDITAVHVSKNAPGGSSRESIVTFWTHRLDIQHPVSIPDGVKCVNLQAQTSGLSSAEVWFLHH